MKYFFVLCCSDEYRVDSMSHSINKNFIVHSACETQKGVVNTTIAAGLSIQLRETG